MCRDFLRRRTPTPLYARAGFGLQLGHAEFHTERACRCVGSKHFRERGGTFKNGDGLIAKVRILANHRLNGKIGNEYACERQRKSSLILSAEGNGRKEKSSSFLKAVSP